MKYIRAYNESIKYEKTFESIDLFDKAGPGYIDVEILRDILIDIHLVTRIC